MSQSTFFSLASADTNDAINAIRNEMAPRLAAHTDRMLLDGDLFARVEALYEQRTALDLDDESRRLVEEYYVDFVRAGARLSDAGKERMQAINARLAALSSRFTPERARRGERLGRGGRFARGVGRAVRGPDRGHRRGGGGAGPGRTVRHPPA